MPAIIFAQRMKIQMNFAFGSVSLLLRRRDALKHKVFMQVCIFLLLPAKEILDLAQIMRKARWIVQFHLSLIHVSVFLFCSGYGKMP
ncbi:uncharacterized protein LOC127905014 isoform X2 [Populus trichocarpa]|uniref:uncharacterized protein LOC127905014 isoform X2 n=1 Tax=Populus trichocarpa TaxID=3694 RepID=UPI0022794962|nr:uncharacterized protein LOC127905014 isoform X2 [Populus trichocarpa]